MKIYRKTVALVAPLIACALTAFGQQTQVEARVNAILSRMTLQQKIDYIGGSPADPTGWNIKPIPLSDLTTPYNPLIIGADGGFGIRYGPTPGVRYPASLALAATWNPDRASDYGKALARDARARGFFACLAPGMDFYRTPLGGRNSEYMTGEDPFIGWTLVPFAVEAIQAEGVWATSKHYVANDQETNRLGGVNEFIDERTLREIYLPPFEAAVRQGHTASLMGAFQRVNGDYCTESHFLITQVLKKDWGFTGFLETDYDAMHDGVKGALAGCDVDMPEGLFFNLPTLLPAVQSGHLPVSVIDDKVRRILREVVGFGFLDRPQLDLSIPLLDPASRLASLNTAREGIVLLKNAGNLLPLSKNTIRSIAVIGENAKGVPPTAYGSSFDLPVRYISEVDGIKALAGLQAKVDFIDACTPDPTTSVWTVAGNGGTTTGLQGEYFNTPDLSGSPAVTRIDQHVDFDWSITPPPVGTGLGETPPPTSSGPPGPVPGGQATFSARWTGQMTPTISGDHIFKVRADGGVRLYVNGQKLIDNFGQVVIDRSIQPTVPVFAKLALQAGTTYSITLEYQQISGFVGVFGSILGVHFSWASLEPPPTLAGYDGVISAVGTSSEYEGEGTDRAFALPEFQSELLQNVSRVNPRTIGVLHGGGSFDIQPFVNQVAGLLHAWWPGQDGGQALGEILFGAVDPSGKLPISFEKRIQDNPAYVGFPLPLNNASAPIIRYSEGIFVGYRGYEKNHIQVQYPFGYGLSYATFEYSNLSVTPSAWDGKGSVEATFTVTNTGKKAGAEVAQLYVGQAQPSVPRPLKELKGFKKVFLDPGQSETITIGLDRRAFAHFDAETHQWRADQDGYSILIGASSQDIRLTGKLEMTTPVLFSVSD